MPARANKASDLAAVTASNPVLDLDNVYLSDRGWAYRHYKREDKSLYWDEVLVAVAVVAQRSWVIELEHIVPRIAQVSARVALVVVLG